MEAFGKEAGQLKRPCLAEGTKFTVELLFKRTASEAAVKSVLDAVRLFGLLGGVGARSRRGWGSVQLLSLTEDGRPLSDVPTTAEAYARALKKLLPAGTTAARYSAFVGGTEGTHLRMVRPTKRLLDAIERKAADNGLSMLEALGAAMVWYRGWGHGGRIATGERMHWPSAKNFPSDHDWFRYGDQPQDFHPERIVFGLPHMYSKTDGVEPAEYSRRASPLLLHVVRLDGQYCGVATILHSDFLPPDENKVTLLHKGHTTTVVADPDFELLLNYLDFAPDGQGRLLEQVGPPILAGGL